MQQNDPIRNLRIGAITAKLEANVPKLEIVNYLVNQGMDTSQAEKLIDEAKQESTDLKEESKKHQIKAVLFSLGLTAVGIGLTLWSRFNAANNNGTYTLYYGFILLGIIYAAVTLWNVRSPNTGQRLKLVIIGIAAPILVLGVGLALDFQQNTWSEFKPADGSFSVSLPGNPTLTQNSVNTASGVVTLNQYSLNKPNISYEVVYGGFEDSFVSNATPDSVLDGSVSGTLSNVQGKLISETKITLGNFPGRDIKLESSDGKWVLESRIYLIKNKIFTLVVQVPKDLSTQSDIIDNLNRFLNSFKIS